MCRASGLSAIRQRGAALFIILLLLVIGAGIVFVSRLKRIEPELNAQRRTAAALAEAKQALLGYAARDLNRPGSLPCADINNDGDTTVGIDASCGPDATGRLPWRLLDLPDLRDGSGERLWYVVSPSFRAFLATPINTNTPGQISLRDANGIVLNDASGVPSTGIVAAVVAPGAALTRQGAATVQDRSCVGGGGCGASSTCLAPYGDVPMCNPTNYLDLVVGVEDNAKVAASSLDGLIQGGARDATGAPRVNDRVLPITFVELNTVLTRRVARELSLTAYSVTPIATGTTIASIASKPAFWASNQWDNAVDLAASNVDIGTATIQLKFLNCNIVFTITGAGMVTLAPRTC
jgi:hypothetical protein